MEYDKRPGLNYLLCLVMSEIPLHKVDLDDLLAVVSGARGMLQKGWTAGEAAFFLRMTEECRCELPEERALEAMARVEARANARIAG